MPRDVDQSGCLFGRGFIFISPIVRGRIRVRLTIIGALMFGYIFVPAATRSFFPQRHTSYEAHIFGAVAGIALIASAIAKGPTGQPATVSSERDAPIK